MKLVEVNWQPSNRQLRQFGIICLFALPLIAWFWGANRHAITTAGVIGGALTTAGFVMPRLLKPLFVALMVVTTPIGIVVGELAMVLIYFCCFLPMALVFRVVGQDPLQLKLESARSSYWQAKKQSSSVASYYRQS